MDAVTDQLEKDGWEVFDISMEYLGYDLKAVSGSDELHVEVKGTREDGTGVLLTPNEVQHALRHPAQSVLAIVSNIRLSRAGGDWQGEGGNLRFFNRWRPQSGTLKALSYEWLPPEPEAE